MKSAQELRSGSIFKKGNDLFLITKAQRHQSTAGRKASKAEMKFKIKNIITGATSEITVEATEKMEDIRLDRRPMQFLYENGGDYSFMDQETYDQITLTKDDLEDNVNYLKEEMVIDVLLYEDRPVGVELPTMVDLEVTYTEPGLRGDTTGRATKPATVETNYELQVPLFINMGDIIRIDTRTGEYSERVNK